MLAKEEVSAYFPFEVKAQFNDYGLKRVAVITQVSTTDIYRMLDNGGGTFHAPYKCCRLILRPLSDLTKPIEHKGEKFVPIMRIMGGDTYNEYDYKIEIIDRPILGKKISISVEDIGEHCINFSLTSILNNTLQYSGWQQLLEWHFDIFGLIERGDAIDLNTLIDKQ